jgi:hypothetical protein
VGSALRAQWRGALQVMEAESAFASVYGEGSRTPEAIAQFYLSHDVVVVRL